MTGGRSRTVRQGLRPATILVLFAAMALLGACKRADMTQQDRQSTWDRNAFFANGSTMQPPVAGTVARAEPNRPVPQPRVITASLVARGHERFDIFCSPCHGRAGDGLSMVVSRGFPQPPDLASPDLRQARAQHIYDVITQGQGAMYSYADRVPPADRWAIAAYVRALQAARATDVAELGPEDRAHLASSP